MSQNTVCGSHENGLIQDVVRVNDCLYGYCPKRWDECRRCDAVVEILMRASCEDPDRMGNVAAHAPSLDKNK